MHSMVSNWHTILKKQTFEAEMVQACMMPQRKHAIMYTSCASMDQITEAKVSMILKFSIDFTRSKLNYHL